MSSLKKIFTILVGLYFFLFFLTTYYTPLLADDFGYRLTAMSSTQPLIDAMIHAKQYYFAWGGRSIAHFFAFLMMWSYSDQYGFLVYALFNTAVLFIIIMGSYLIITPNEKNFRTLTKDSIFTFSLLICALTINAKYHYQTIIWATGAAHYLWMYVLLIILLVRAKPYLIEGKDQSWHLLDYILFFIVGLSYENVGLSLIGLLGLRFVTKRPFHFPKINQWIPMVFILAGSVIMLSAPGNQIRDKIANPEGTGSIFQKIQWWFESLAIFFGRPEGALVLLLGGSILFSLRKFRKNESLITLIKKNKSVYNLGLLFCLMTMAYIGHTGNFYGRKSFNIGWMFCLFLMSLIVNSGLVQKIQSMSNKFYLTSVTILLLLSCSRWGYDATIMKQFALKAKSRELAILEEKQKGNDSIITYPLKNPFDLDDLTEDPTFWVNASYAQFLGVNTLTIPKK